MTNENKTTVSTEELERLASEADLPGEPNEALHQAAERARAEIYRRPNAGWIPA